MLYLSQLPGLLWLDLGFSVDCSVKVIPLELLEITVISDLGIPLTLKDICCAQIFILTFFI